MSGLKVYKVTARGLPNLGLRQIAKRDLKLRERLRSEKIGVTAHTSQGIAKIRLDDFDGVRLHPALHPNAFAQSFVDGPVVEKAKEVIESDPRIMDRLDQTQESSIDWENLTFAITRTDSMLYATVKHGGSWQENHLVPFEDLRISPVAGVLHYGFGLFEGMKAYRGSNDEILLFRPKENAKRIQAGAERLVLNPIPKDFFLEAVTKVVLANERWIPPSEKGALYIRPFQFGSGEVLGLKPAPENTFIIYVTPVGPYFKGGMKPIDLVVSKEHHRAGPGGTGAIKAIGNYASGLLAGTMAKEAGFTEVLFLDAKFHDFVEEAGASNFFSVIDGALYTPKLTDAILPGITRDSIIQLARDLGIKVLQKRLAVEHIQSAAQEVFCSGTAATIVPVGSITNGSQKTVFNKGKVGKITRKLYNALTAIQEGRAQDPFGWIHRIK